MPDLALVFDALTSWPHVSMAAVIATACVFIFGRRRAS